MIATTARRLAVPLVAAGALMTLAALPLAAQTAPAPSAGAAAEAPQPAQAPQLLDDIVLGKADAPLTIVEYASYTCPHCGEFARENLPQLKAEYVDTGKVRFIMRDVYFDAPGLWSGILAHCDPAKYYPVGEMLLTTQDKWLAPAKTGDEVAANLRKVGLQAGMTEAQMDACWADKAMVERLVATYQANATKDGLEGTPTFIIGGEKVPNQSWDKLKAKIDEKLAAAPAPAAGTTAPAPAAPAN